MIIKSLDLIGFGKFHHRQTELGPRVNVIYGGNEAGKSTMHRFIHGMFFGLKRGRGKGAAKDDYTRYKPWENGQCYEGLMVIEHKGHTYRLYRNFYKEDEVFRIFDETSGKQLFLENEQIDSLVAGLNEANFKNTVSVRQQESRIEDGFSSVLQTYIANMSMGKNESVDIGAALLQLSGRERQIKRQINGNRAIDIREQIEKTEQALSEMGAIDEHIAALERDERLLEAKLLECREDMKHFQSCERKERMEGRGLLEQYQMTSRMLHEEKQKNQTERNRTEHYFAHQLWFRAFLGLTAAAVLLMALQLGFRLDVLFLKVLTGLLLIGAFFGLAKTSFKKPEYHQGMDEADLSGQLKAISSRLAPYIKKYGKDMMGAGQYERDVSIFNGLVSEKEKLIRKKEKLLYEQESRDELAAKLEALKEASAEIKERAGKYESELRALSLAKQVIEEVSGEIHETFGSRMNDEAEDIFRHILGSDSGRAFHIDEKLNIRMDNLKEQLPMERLSAGTIDQLYFALRLCAAKIMFGEESMPLILDDAFAFYDDERLRNLIDWLVKNYKGQIIFFTCHRREADLLEELGYDYNYIEL